METNKNENCLFEKTNKTDKLLTRWIKKISEKAQITKFGTREVMSLQIVNTLKE